MTILLFVVTMETFILIVAREEYVQARVKVISKQNKRDRVARNMSAVDVNKKSFWKRNANKVPGR